MKSGIYNMTFWDGMITTLALLATILLLAFILIALQEDQRTVDDCYVCGTDIEYGSCFEELVKSNHSFSMGYPCNYSYPRITRTTRDDFGHCEGCL